MIPIPHSRKRRLAVAGAALLLVLAGCSGGTPSVEASGSPTWVAEDAVADTAFERVGATNRTLNATVTATVQGDVEGRESVDVTATVPVATYRRSGDPPSVLAVASSPVVEVLENPLRTADPLATLSPPALVAFVQSTYAEPERLEHAGNRTVKMLGEEATVATYRGSATGDGATVEVVVEIARLQAGGSVVTVVAVRPASSAAHDAIETLLRSVRTRTTNVDSPV